MRIGHDVDASVKGPYTYEQEERRWKCIPVGDNFLYSLFQQRRSRYMRIGDIMCGFVVEPLPPDAQIVRVWYDLCRQSLMLVFESKEFEPVKPGEEVPLFEALCYSKMFRKVEGDKYELVDQDW